MYVVTLRVFSWSRVKYRNTLRKLLGKYFGFCASKIIRLRIGQNIRQLLLRLAGRLTYFGPEYVPY